MMHARWGCAAAVPCPRCLAACLCTSAQGHAKCPPTTTLQAHDALPGGWDAMVSDTTARSSSAHNVACYARPCRRVMLPGGRDVVLSDTVGFISDLPHALVEAFRVRGTGRACGAAERTVLLGVVNAGTPTIQRGDAQLMRCGQLRGKVSIGGPAAAAELAQTKWCCVMRCPNSYMLRRPP